MSSRFVTEAEVVEARQKRQEEWEKVRQPDQPLEKPEEPYDCRSLYERLKEQKDKKDLDFEESHKLKNLIRGLDDDEVDFLEIVDKAKMVAEQKQQIEENNELLEFRQRVASLQEKSMDDKISAEIAKPKEKTTKVSTRPSQKSILSGIVRKRKASEHNEETKSQLLPQNKLAKNGNASSSIDAPKKHTENSITTPPKSSNKKPPILVDDLSEFDEGALKCIGILPGIGKYKESSDSEKSTDTDDEYDFHEFDWMGRKIKHDSECQ